MKLALSQDLVFKLSLDHMPYFNEKGEQKWTKCDKANYLVYDDHKAAPPGFALRVGKRASVYLIDKKVGRQKLKIYVGLAYGKKGAERPIQLSAARAKAFNLGQEAKLLGGNPTKAAERVEAASLTMRQVWDGYIKTLKTRAVPIKENSLDSLEKARKKLEDWEDRRVRQITAAEVVDRFDLHAITKGHRTAAEAMGRWAKSAIQNAIDREAHNAKAEMRSPTLTYNPFTILSIENKYRDRKQLEREYKQKRVRNPLELQSTLGPWIKATWEYRQENSLAADFLLLTMLWGMRQGESAPLKWRDRISDKEAAICSWVDIKKRWVFVFDAKNREDHEFPIADCALALLKLRREASESPWVFPTASPMSKKGHYSSAESALRTTRERAGVAVLRGHDLRRTFGRVCESLGFSDRQIKKLLGHSVNAEAMGRYTDAERAEVLDRMGRIEEKMLSSAPSVYNALRPRNLPRMPEAEPLDLNPKRKSRAKRSAKSKR